MALSAGHDVPGAPVPRPAVAELLAIVQNDLALLQRGTSSLESNAKQAAALLERLQGAHSRRCEVVAEAEAHGSHASDELRKAREEVQFLVAKMEQMEKEKEAMRAQAEEAVRERERMDARLAEMEGIEAERRLMAARLADGEQARLEQLDHVHDLERALEGARKEMRASSRAAADAEKRAAASEAAAEAARREAEEVRQEAEERARAMVKEELEAERRRAEEERQAAVRAATAAAEERLRGYELEIKLLQNAIDSKAREEVEKRVELERTLAEVTAALKKAKKELVAANEDRKRLRAMVSQRAHLMSESFRKAAGDAGGGAPPAGIDEVLKDLDDLEALCRTSLSS
eukprot:tig00000219_g19486.t1